MFKENSIKCSAFTCYCQRCGATT